MTDLERAIKVTLSAYFGPEVSTGDLRKSIMRVFDAHLKEDAVDKAWLADAERRAKGWMERAENAEAENARLHEVANFWEREGQKAVNEAARLREELMAQTNRAVVPPCRKCEEKP